VFHIGSHTGAGEDAGLARLVDGIDRVLRASASPVRLLLENVTGGGGKLGYRLENLASVLDRLPQHADRLGVCIDTAHLWGAGFDLDTPEAAEACVAELDRDIGVTRIPVLHVNDARVARGSHRDVHARLGEGQIPLVGLAAFLRHPLLAGTTALLETPLPEVASGKPDWERERELMLAAREVAGLPVATAVSVPVAVPATE
jgi:deoxyribonuclease-4